MSGRPLRSVTMTPPQVVLDEDRPLSESAIWDLSRAYYEAAGPRAWSEGEVPSYATSNPFVADAFARVALGFLEDEEATGAVVVELGAGPGRFGRHFLRTLERRLPRSATPHARVRYVMTDFSASNVAHLSRDASLARYRDAGTLHVARFDLERDHEIALDSGELLRADALDVPLIVIANYVYCAVRQDAFRVIGGRLHRALATVVEEGEPGDLDRVRVRWRHEPAPATCYEDPRWERTLRGYERLVDAGFSFPVAALAALDRLRALTRRGTLALVADRGDAHAHAFAGRGDASGVVHGAVSFRANLHALGEVAVASGGAFLRAPRPAALLETVAVAFGERPRDATRRAFADAVAELGPDRFFAIKRGVEAAADALDLDALLAFLALARHDVDAFRALAPALARLAASAPVQASRPTRERIEDALDAVAEEREAAGDGDADVALAVAEAYLALGLSVKALMQLEESLKARGPRPDTLAALARVHRALGRPEAARAFAAAAAESSHAEPARGDGSGK